MSWVPAVPDLREVQKARSLLSHHLPRTRLIAAPSLQKRIGVPVFVKLESELPTGSFKPRGALYALATRVERCSVHEVVTASTGNHGAAVAFAAASLGVKASIFLPRNPNPVKRQKIAELNARIIEVGDDLVAASAAASEYAHSNDAYLLNDITDRDLPAGPATIAAEIMEQLPSTSTIVVPVGDTALIRGIVGGSRQRLPGPRIVAVQAENAPSYYLSWKRGTVVPTATCNTIADGLATRTPDIENVRTICEVIDDFVLVSERQMRAAMRLLLLEERIVSEPSGAAATAAVLQLRDLPGPIVVLMTGANVSESVLQQALSTCAEADLA